MSALDKLLAELKAAEKKKGGEDEDEANMPAAKLVRAKVIAALRIVKANKQAKVENLIGLLNPVIRGWATYHRHDASKETFGSVDAAIFKVLWQWARRRHPKKEQVLGQGEILPHAGRSQVGLLRERPRREGQAPTSLALLGVEDADQTAYKD